jgi:hypothetical protein
MRERQFPSSFVEHLARILDTSLKNNDLQDVVGYLFILQIHRSVFVYLPSWTFSLSPLINPCPAT